MEWFELYQDFYPKNKEEAEPSDDGQEQAMILAIDAKRPLGTSVELGFSRTCERCDVEYFPIKETTAWSDVIHVCPNCRVIVLNRITALKSPGRKSCPTDHLEHIFSPELFKRFVKPNAKKN